MHWFAFWTFVLRDWKVVPRDEAQQKPYFGFRGWLLLFYLLTILSCLQAVAVLLSPLDAQAVEAYGGNPAVARTFFVTYAVIHIPFLVLAPLKHPLTPKIWIGTLWVIVVMYVILIDMPGRIDSMIVGIALAVVIASLMTWYVLHSKRVNVTYLNRVPAKEAPKQIQSVSYAYGRARKYSRIGWVIAGFIGVVLLLNLLTLMTSP